MSIGFTGTRAGMTPRQMDAVISILDRGNISEFHSGDCVGADHQAWWIATTLGWRTIGHPPINPAKRAWCKFDSVYPTKSYPVRNRDIAIASTGRLIAAPKRFKEELYSGTWQTIGMAYKLYRRVTIVWPNGEISDGC